MVPSTIPCTSECVSKHVTGLRNLSRFVLNKTIFLLVEAWVYGVHLKEEQASNGYLWRCVRNAYIPGLVWTWLQYPWRTCTLATPSRAGTDEGLRVISMGRSQWNQSLELCLGVVHVRKFGKHTIWEKIYDLIRKSYYLGKKNNKHGITDSRKWCRMGKEALRPNKMLESSRSLVHFPGSSLQVFSEPLKIPLSEWISKGSDSVMKTASLRLRQLAADSRTWGSSASVG